MIAPQTKVNSIQKLFTLFFYLSHKNKTRSDIYIKKFCGVLCVCCVVFWFCWLIFVCFVLFFKLECLGPFFFTLEKQLNKRCST